MKTRRAVVLKLSGEALGKQRPLDGYATEDVCSQVAAIAEAGITVGVVVGGGNFIRGGDHWGSRGISRETLDTWGMRATLFNAQVLRDQLHASSRVRTLVMAKPDGPAAVGVTPWEPATLANPDVDVFIVGGGLGQYGISTDVAAPELAKDLGSPLIVMSKHGVDGIYSGDPNHLDHRLPRPELLTELSAGDALEAGLKVMDHEAIRRCRDYGITVQVVGASVTDSLRRAVLDGEGLGSVMHPSHRPPRRLQVASSA